MSDRGTANQDPFRIWLASSRAFFASQSTNAPPQTAQMTEPLQQKCEELFAAWNRFAQTYAKAGNTVVAGAAGSPFDPVGWLDAAGGGGYGDLWRWFGDDADPKGADAKGADPWREQRDALTASREWLAYSAALERYRAVMGAAWLQAFRRFAEELAQNPGPGDGLPGWEVIQARWQDAAGAELAAASVLFTGMWSAGTMIGPLVVGAGMDVFGNASMPYLISGIYLCYLPFFWYARRGTRTSA